MEHVHVSALDGCVGRWIVGMGRGLWPIVGMEGREEGGSLAGRSDGGVEYHRVVGVHDGNRDQELGQDKSMESAGVCVDF